MTYKSAFQLHSMILYSAVLIRCHPSCSNTMNKLRAKLWEKQSNFGTPQAVGYWELYKYFGWPTLYSCEGGTTYQGVCIRTTFVFSQPDCCMSLSGQTTRGKSRRKVNRQCFPFGSLCGLVKSPSHWTDKRGNTQRCVFPSEQQEGGRPIYLLSAWLLQLPTGPAR